MKLGVVLCLVAVLGLGSAACGKSKKSSTSSSETTTTTAGAASAGQVTKGDKSSFYLAASSQSSDGKTIKVDEAVFQGSGWVAIHSDAGGAPGPVIGVSKMVAAGTTNNIEITLDKPLTASAKVWPMLHLEDNNNTTYDFPNGDAPAKVGADVVVVPIDITVR